MRFDWNGLRLGDRVLVHASSGADMALSPGTVAMVDGVKGSNGVGIRVGTDGRDGEVVWPSRLAVHVDPPDPSESCWRCQALSNASGNQLAASAALEAARPSSGKRSSRPGRASHPREARATWGKWRAERSATSAAAFCESVSSWIEGTAAQLLRPQWRSSADRPSTAAVEMRLRHHLALDACADEPEYPDALALARRQVSEELRQTSEGHTRWTEGGPAMA